MPRPKYVLVKYLKWRNAVWLFVKFKYIYATIFYDHYDQANKRAFQMNFSRPFAATTKMQYHL